MERESFEDVYVADILNEYFISIKVDREERPDIDHIYMSVCRAISGQGGWPLSVFITPDKKPFYAGTYFPKHDRMGLPGFMSLLKTIAKKWKEDRTALIRSGDLIISTLHREQNINQMEIKKDIIREAFYEFKHDFDSVYGGFGYAPKFPTPHNLYFLLRYWHLNKEDAALKMVEKTLDAMYRGGIFDHIGSGFSRYSTDRKWLVPHFEKMLYDNALLAIAYLEAYQVTKKQKYAEVAKRIFTYILRDMTSVEGGFFSAEDADSEGEEGKFYIWSFDEVKHILGEEDGKKFCEYFDITRQGNFEGLNIPNLIKGIYPKNEDEFIDMSRQKLFKYREKRIHPHKDDKILTAWNGLMIAAMSIGGRVLNEQQYIEVAEKAVRFIFSKLVKEDGRLIARYRDGEAAHLAYVDDYAFLIWGLIELYETTYKPEYLKKALILNDDLIKYFWDEKEGGLFVYGSDSEQLIIRPKEIYDGATPSGNSVSTLNFIRLARLTGQSELEERAMQQFKTFGSFLQSSVRACPFLLIAFMYSQAPSREVILVNGKRQSDTDEMLKTLQEDFRPFTISLVYSDKLKGLEDISPYVTEYKAVNGMTTAYVCQNFACQPPIFDSNQFRKILN